jgi:hypothetical protein
MEWWSDGVMECWSDGVMEWWSGGVLEWWSGGAMERWSDGAKWPLIVRPGSPGTGTGTDFFGSGRNTNHKSLTMSNPDGHIVRKAFLTKYGYAPDLTYEEILCEFEKRYDQAQSLRLTTGGLHRMMRVIEGMPEAPGKEEVALEREARKHQMKQLSAESGYGAAELEQLVEVYASRLEAEWIRKT